MTERFEREFSFTTAGGVESKALFVLTQNADGSWYATAHNFGCSRDHAYWYHAVRELMDAHCIKQWF